MYKSGRLNHYQIKTNKTMTRKLIISLTLLACATATQAGTTANHREAVYLHIDNPAYFLGERLHFAATVVNPEDTKADVESKVLYVDLVAPEGYVVETTKCKIDGGRCSGTIDLRPSLLSGLYEVRAYTRYMAKADAANYFTRVVPVYESPEGGDYSARTIFSRKRNVKYDKATMPRPLMPSEAGNDGAERISISCDTASLRPFGLVRMTVKGKPGSRISLSATDAAGYAGGWPAATIADFMRAESNPKTDAAAQNAIEPETEITASGTVTAEKKRFLKAPKAIPQPGVKLAYALYADDGGTKYGSATTDSLGAFSIGLGDTGGTLLLRYNKADYDKELRIAVDKWFAPRPRAFTGEEEALLNEGCRAKKPLRAADEGLTHSAIHTTVADEVEWARAFADEDIFDYTNMNGMHNFPFIATIMRRWGYPIGFPTRVIGVDEYPGDGIVPEAKWIADYDGFNINKYDEIIIRTDSAICVAYAYNEAQTYAHPQTAWSSQGSTITYHRLYSNYTKPTTVICFVEKTGKEKLMAAPVTETDHAYSRVGGVAAGATLAAPDYSGGQPSADNRRLLYWNPDLTLDANGEATVEFYNNSSCRQIVVSAEGVTADGRPVVYKRDGTR